MSTNQLQVYTKRTREGHTNPNKGFVIPGNVNKFDLCL